MRSNKDRLKRFEGAVRTLGEPQLSWQILKAGTLLRSLKPAWEKSRLNMGMLFATGF